MRIKFGDSFINTDHIAYAHFYPKGDQSTNYTTPCLMITFAGEKAPMILYPHDDQPEAVWELIVSEADKTLDK